MDVYCKNPTKHTNSLRGKMQSFLVLRWAVLIVTTVLWMADNLPRVKVANATVWHLACGWTWSRTFQSTPPQTDPWHVGAPSRLIIYHPFKPIFFQRFRPRTVPEKILGARAQIADNFRRKSLACGNVSLLAPYFFYSSDILAPLIGWRRPGQLPG